MKKLILLLLLFIIISCNYSNDDINDTEKFIKRDGDKIYLDNVEYRFKGVNFNNLYWDYSTGMQYHHKEEDYKRVKDIGFNTVRFALNYYAFETDESPYEYKAEGFNWLDKNIEWAKDQNLHIIIDMHVPQGGIQGTEEGNELWNDDENQNRLISLWKEIAKRYDDESTVAAYDILNEPYPTESIDQWKDLSGKIIDAIREEDSKHLIIMAQILGLGENWTMTEEEKFVLSQDENIMYEFHYYYPFDYTNQLTSWTDFSEIDGGQYPDYSMTILPDDMEYFDSTYMSEIIEYGTSDWKLLESDYYKVEDPEIILGFPVLKSIKNRGIAYFDNFTIKEYDEKGMFIRNVYNENIKSINDWVFWSSNDEGDLSSVFEGYSDNYALSIQGDEEAVISCASNVLYFEPILNYQYKIQGYVKGTNISEDSLNMFTIDFEKSKSGKEIYSRDKIYLESKLLDYVDFGNKYNVPIYMGEFGVYSECLDNKGGVDWIEDILELNDKYNLNYSFYTYHGDNFGIFKNAEDYPSFDNYNEEVYYTIINYLNKF